VRHLVDHCGHVQQGFAGDAAHVQAHAAELGVALDQHHLEAQVGRAEGGAVAAGATAEHEQVALQIGTAGEADSSKSRGNDLASVFRSRWTVRSVTFMPRSHN
jgi:hypothetical protein